MASVGHRIGEERTSVPRIVLPITSRGLVVTDRLCWGILTVAMAIAAGLILYLNRGTTFYGDELNVLFKSPGLDLRGVIEPVNGHLGAITTLAYKAVLEAFGADYVAFRVFHVLALLIAGGLFYALTKRRIGALPALAPTLVLLFFGSAWLHTVIPIGFGIFLCISAGLGALLCLERGDLRGDVAACALLVLSVATFTTGLAFLVGVAIAVLWRPDRRRRSWVFLVPLVLYAAWWLWSLSEPASALGSDHTKLSNLLLIPNWFAESLAASTAALAGLGYDFTGELQPGVVEPGWGRVLAVLAVVALALRIRRGNLPPSLWASLGIVLAFWALGAVAFSELRFPGIGRYIYMGALGVLLVATDAARGVRFTKLGLAALFAACAVGVAGNVALLREGSASFRADSRTARSNFAVLELARDHLRPGFTTNAGILLFPVPADDYLAVVDSYGSSALSPSELEQQPESVRENSDRVLADALGLRLRPGGEPEGDCTRLRSEARGAPIALELPPGGATLRARGAAPATLSVGRFASSPSVELGRLAPGEAETLRIPTDASPTPWRASIEEARSVEVCAPS